MSDTIVKILPNTTTVKNVTNETVVKFPVSLPGNGVSGGDSFSVNYTAGQSLSSGRAVVLDGVQIFYFNPMDPEHHGRMFGITKTSASVGAQVTVQHMGVITDSALGFTPDLPLWVAANGAIVSTQPTGVAVVQKAGISITGSKMLIDFSVSIKTN